MRKIIGIVMMVVTLSACGNDAKTQNEAVQDFRDQVGISSMVTDDDIRGLLLETCNVLDVSRPGELANRLIEYPQNIVNIMMNNATESFCPEHRREVIEYLLD